MSDLPAQPMRRLSELKRRAEDTNPPEACALRTVEQRLDDGDERMTRIESSVHEVKEGIAELLDILHNGKGFFKVLGYFATAIKWTAGLAGPMIGLWYVIKDASHK